MRSVRAAYTKQTFWYEYCGGVPCEAVTRLKPDSRTAGLNVEQGYECQFHGHCQDASNGIYWTCCSIYELFAAVGFSLVCSVEMSVFERLPLPLGKIMKLFMKQKWINYWKLVTKTCWRSNNPWMRFVVHLKVVRHHRPHSIGAHLSSVAGYCYASMLYVFQLLILAYDAKTSITSYRFLRLLHLYLPVCRTCFAAWNPWVEGWTHRRTQVWWPISYWDSSHTLTCLNMF